MRFLRTLADIKSPPKSLYLVDIALVLSIVPHLDKLKFPMLVYLLAVLIVLIASRKVPKALQYALALFGVLSVISSFYTDFNFSSLNRFTLFVSLLNALLIYAVSLQRLKGELNFYLAFSPAMLLMLSFFLHNSVPMLFYTVFTLFVFMLLLVWSKMHTPLYDALKMALTLFAYALPVVALLFLVFPRISFEKAVYGFHDDFVKKSGHNGVMSLGSDAAMNLSSQVLMEVYFENGLPKEKGLYFRGTTLYVDRNDSFRQLPDRLKKPLAAGRKAIATGGRVAYSITLYPHNEKWLYALDIPASSPPKSTLLDDYTIVSDKKIDKRYRYEMHSDLSYLMNAPLRKEIREASLRFYGKRDAISSERARQLVAPRDKQTLENIAAYFRSLNLVYTLKPDHLDKKRPVDSFLYESKKGYCVHFAAAFAYMARASGLPARVVTGFLVNPNEALENYLVVRESDAHAWVEVYLQEKGWTRVETTAFAERIEGDVLQRLGVEGSNTGQKWLKRLNLHLMYLKYVIETWILEYSRVKQMEILHALINSSTYLVAFIVNGILFTALSIGVAIFVSARRCHDRVLCILRPLMKHAEKSGLEKQPNESMHDFLCRLKEKVNADMIDEIDLLYHKIKYAKKYETEDIAQLKKIVNAIKK
ncbi:DUF3488 and transglutaminase-like domain-containing protein [Sulfurimonas sp. HSL3-7]|uniref:transglutaminase family protein n=1 Tax=Sulfonitrofixus jiaomeiensis TaxID=3131938 RepID=UPI0031F74FB1